MPETKWADVSEFQPAINDSYPYRVVSIRSNDGTYRDRKFAANLSWCKAACDSGKLDFFIVYFVWESNWQQTVETLKAVIGTPHPRMAVMVDVESWSGRYTGDQSAGINASVDAVAAWLGDRRRVIGYGNVGDLTRLWPGRGDIKLVVAAYGSNPDFPNKIAHQYADNEVTPPFGPCDINSADGLDVPTLMGILGLSEPVTKAATAAAPTSGPDHIPYGWDLTPHQSLTSLDGGYRLDMQGDGNLVIYRVRMGSEFPIWQSGTANHPGAFLRFQVTDRNVVIYDTDGNALWQAGCADRSGNTLVIQGDGNLVVYTSENVPVWNSKGNPV